MKRRIAKHLSKTVATAMALSAAITIVTPTPSANAESLSTSEKLTCIKPWNTGDCLAARDAKNWATSVVEWKFPGPAHNNMADAFRHCIWSGAMSQRIGPNAAAMIANGHEKAAGSPANEKMMDDRNNATGIVLGAYANSQGLTDTWGFVMNRCETLARDRKLFGLDGIQGKY